MKYFFIGIAGSGMSSLAQFIAQKGDIVCGSDRLFCNDPANQIRIKLENCGIKTYEQGNSSIDSDTDYVVISTAIENNVVEYIKAQQLGLKIIHRSDLLAQLSYNYDTIAVAGTSGKSTTTAMIYTILDYAGYHPSIINGSALKSLQNKSLLGNAKVGDSRWLVIEADESDGSLTKYRPKIGIILNIDRDHKEYDQLNKIFAEFANNSQNLIVNLANKRSLAFSKNNKFDFGTPETDFYAKKIVQNIENITFEVQNQKITIPQLGLHNVENALAAISVASCVGISLDICAKALSDYQGIERRMQIVGKTSNYIVIDDFAHNPSKIASAIRTCQTISNRVIAIFQPHGYGPINFFKDDLIAKLIEVLRPLDQIFICEPFFVGGTVTKNTAAQEIVEHLQKSNLSAFYVSDRNRILDLLQTSSSIFQSILVMGARDASLSDFAKEIFLNLKQKNGHNL